MYYNDILKYNNTLQIFKNKLNTSKYSNLYNYCGIPPWKQKEDKNEQINNGNDNEKNQTNLIDENQILKNETKEEEEDNKTEQNEINFNKNNTKNIEQNQINQNNTNQEKKTTFINNTKSQSNYFNSTNKTSLLNNEINSNSSNLEYLERNLNGETLVFTLSYL